jgi:hypothetical protein
VTCYSYSTIVAYDCTSVCQGDYGLVTTYQQTGFYDYSGYKYRDYTNCAISNCDWLGWYSVTNWGGECFYLEYTCGYAAFSESCFGGLYSDVRLKMHYLN